jgi:DNA-binding beta-propeller fold protein YncE
MPHPTTLLRLLVLALLLTGLAGCDLFGNSDDDAPISTGVFVGNQGNFSDGNGSVTTYDPESGLSTARAISDLSSIVQSVAVEGGVLYVTGNTADRLFRFDASTRQPLPGVDVFSPRYLAVEEGRAFVTSLFARPGTFSGGRLTAVDLASGAVVDSVVFEPGVLDNPEGVAVSGGRVFVAGHGFGSGSSIASLPVDDLSATPQLVDAECVGPRSISADAEGELWIVCTGRTLFDANFTPIGEEAGAVHVMRPDGAIVARFALDGRASTSGPGQEAFYSAQAQELLVVVGSARVLRFDTSANQLAGQVVLPASEQPIGAVGLDATRDRLYVARTAGFDQSGYVTVHAGEGGDELARFQAGVAPTSIAFDLRGN